MTIYIFKCICIYWFLQCVKIGLFLADMSSKRDLCNLWVHGSEILDQLIFVCILYWIYIIHLYIHQIIHNIYIYIYIHQKKALCKMWDFHITRSERRIPKKHHQPSSWQLLRNLPDSLHVLTLGTRRLEIWGSPPKMYKTFQLVGQALLPIKHPTFLHHPNNYWLMWSTVALSTSWTWLLEGAFLFWFRRVLNGATRCWEMLSQSHSHPKVWDVVHEYC